jgi:hypothetical protein
MTGMQWALLAAWSVAVVAGVLVMTGYLAPREMTREHGMVLGAVITLYGVYRWVITYYRRHNGGSP